MAPVKFHGRAVIPGKAEGIALISSEPLSFWGGYDSRSGEIIDRRHPLSGENSKGRILGIPSARGSSTTAAVLLESIRSGTAPAAIITTTPDFFFALASVVADELYSKVVPLLSLNEDDFAQLQTGDRIRIDVDGSLEVEQNQDGRSTPMHPV